MVRSCPVALVPALCDLWCRSCLSCHEIYNILLYNGLGLVFTQLPCSWQAPVNSRQLPASHLELLARHCQSSNSLGQLPVKRAAILPISVLTAVQWFARCALQFSITQVATIFAISRVVQPHTVLRTLHSVLFQCRHACRHVNMGPNVNQTLPYALLLHATQIALLCAGSPAELKLLC